MAEPSQATQAYGTDVLTPHPWTIRMASKVVHGPAPVAEALISNTRTSARRQLKLQDHGQEAGVLCRCLFTSTPIPSYLLQSVINSAVQLVFSSLRYDITHPPPPALAESTGADQA